MSHADAVYLGLRLGLPFLFVAVVWFPCAWFLGIWMAKRGFHPIEAAFAGAIGAKAIFLVGVVVALVRFGI